MQVEQATILMAEDDVQDQILAEEALKDAHVLNPLICVKDGEQLMDYLHRRPPYDDAVRYPWPSIVLLDLNMPKKDGRQCLEEIRATPRLRHLPVVVLTTSDMDEEIMRSYQLGANSYITKPVDFDKMVVVMRSFGNYWFSIVERPRASTESSGY